MAWYRDAEHFKGVSGHEVEGVWYPRVTKILDIKSKPALDYFFKEMESYAAAESVKNKSAEEGSLVHAVVQKIAVGESTDVPKEIAPAVSSFEELKDERDIFFYPEYNLQTAAYLEALREYEISRALALPKEIETRWILRINQHKICQKCGATLREKGGRTKIKNGSAGWRTNGVKFCKEDEHKWGKIVGDVELKEFPYFYKDVKAFLAAKTLWEWENDYWLRQVGYLR